MENIAHNITFDNSDGKQQTLTGSHTTHHTTRTIFQTGCENKIVEDWKVSESDEGEQVDEEFPDYGNYKIFQLFHSLQVITLSNGTWT